MIFKICDVCGKQFKVELSDRNRDRRRYCGIECAEKAAYERKKAYAKYGRKPMFNVECQYCGKIFLTNMERKTTCSEECNYERSLLRQRENGRKRREAIRQGWLPNPKPKQKKVATVEEVQKKAREAGLSYGQYMAQLYMQEGRTGNGRA